MKKIKLLYMSNSCLELPIKKINETAKVNNEKQVIKEVIVNKNYNPDVPFSEILDEETRKLDKSVRTK